MGTRIMGDKFRFFLTGLAACAVVGVTVTGHGIWSTVFHHQERLPFQVPLSQLRDFDGITLAGPDDVVVTPGTAFSVTLDGDRNAARYMNLYVRGGVLHVERREHDGWWGPGGSMKVRVTMPGLTRVWLAGSGDISVDKVDAKAFAAMLQGSGSIDLKNVTSDSVRLTLQGSGDAALSGNTKSLALSLSGSGHVVADKLDARSADIAVTGSGGVRAHAEDTARLMVNGSGFAHVTGTTRCEINRSGSGEADCTS
jgi:hypothetical protein